MTSNNLREEFLSFFQKKSHKIVASSSLLPTDPSVLFTTAGMQQFKEYFLGKKSPYGKSVASCQKCFRTSDIEEVGDERHLTFFEMLGNFSFGGYGKEEAIKLAKDFLDSIKIKIDYVTVFGGDKAVPRDEESAKIWGKLGFSEEKGNLKFCGREDNFWGPTGEEGPCGPTTEVYSKALEIWNIVFNQYYCNIDKTLKKLDILGVDTGMGLERLAAASQNVSTVFETDLFEPVMSSIPGENNDRARRIIADHIKAAVFLISEGILPSNVERGYVLRRILRRAIRYGKLLDLDGRFLTPLAQKVTEVYQAIYPELALKETEILAAIQKEEERFEKVIQEGLKQGKKIFNAKTPIPDDIYSKIMQVGDKKEIFRTIYQNKGHFDKNDFEKLGIAIPTKKIIDASITGKEAFDLYQSFGFPIEMIVELAQEKNLFVDIESFKEELKNHQVISRVGAEKKFKGGLADGDAQTIKYHTATHLLLAALREVLGPEIYQKGSNITAERLRFDFNYSQKMTDAQIKEVEGLVNQKIKEDIPVEMKEMPKAEALKIAKVSFDPEKYGAVVKVYEIGDFSIELCGGPHVKRTSELGSFKIAKEESSGAGVRRIRAVLE